jgi:hypothetical protein
MAQNRIWNHFVVPPIPVQTTIKDQCWLTLMALQRELKLREAMRYLENVWQEISKAKKLLGIAT